MKTCKKCGAEKDESFFRKQRRTCKECEREDNIKRCKERYHKNIDQAKEDKKKYYQENKEQILQDRKGYHQENKKQRSEYNKEYREENKETLSLRSKEYYKENKIQILHYRKTYEYERRKNDPIFRTRKIVSAMIGKMLRNNYSSKNGSSCLLYLPWTPIELNQHIEKQFESWMTWANRGKYDPKTWNDNDQSTWTWQIDHIVPHSTFKYTSMDSQEFRDCWALSKSASIICQTKFN